MDAARKYDFNQYDYIEKENNRLKELAKNNRIKMRRRERLLNTLMTTTLYAICFLVVFSLAYILIERNSMIVKSKLENLRLETEINDKNLEIEQLESAISQNLDLTVIEKKAMTELNMVYPETYQTVYIQKQWEYKTDEDEEIINSISKLSNGVKNEE